MAQGPRYGSSVPYGSSWLENQEGTALIDAKRCRGFHLAIADFQKPGETSAPCQIIARYSARDDELLATYRDPAQASAAFRGLTTAMKHNDLGAFSWLPDTPPPPDTDHDTEKEIDSEPNPFD